MARFAFAAEAGKRYSFEAKAFFSASDPYVEILSPAGGVLGSNDNSDIGVTDARIDFLAGVTTALDHVRAQHHGAKVLVVSSGGPISTAVGHVLRTPPETTIELNLRLRNTSVTEFAFTPKRHMLVTYNTLPHLDGPAWEGWVTYA